MGAMTPGEVASADRDIIDRLEDENERLKCQLREATKALRDGGSLLDEARKEIKRLNRLLDA